MTFATGVVRRIRVGASRHPRDHTSVVGRGLPPERENPRGCGGFGSAPERIRTSDLRFRRPTLYPAELRAQRDFSLARPRAWCGEVGKSRSGEGGIRTLDGALNPILP